LLQTIAGPDPLDPGCADRPVPDYVARLEEKGAPPRMGRLRGFFEDMAEPVIRKMIGTVCERFERQGATVVSVALPAGFAEVLAHHRTVMAVEAAVFHGPRLRRHPEDYQQKIQALLEEGLSCPGPEYARCKQRQWELAAAMPSCFAGADVLVTPATMGPAPDAGSTGDPAFNSPWSYTGLPTLSLPAGWDAEGLPLAIQLIAPPWAEGELFAAAAWCEQVLAFERREPPL